MNFWLGRKLREGSENRQNLLDFPPILRHYFINIFMVPLSILILMFLKISLSISIFLESSLSISIFQKWPYRYFEKCRYINYQYVSSIYRTPLSRHEDLWNIPNFWLNVIYWKSCRSGSDFRQWSLSVMARTVVPSSYLISDWVMDNAR